MTTIESSIPYRPRRPDVIDEQFEGESVVVNLGTGVYYAFNPTASVIWATISTGRSPATVASLLKLDTEQICGFFQQLLDEQLLEPAPSEMDSEGFQTAKFVAEEPQMQRFTDMQDLLMLDPIHDINLAGDGWPVVPEQA